MGWIGYDVIMEDQVMDYLGGKMGSVMDGDSGG